MDEALDNDTLRKKHDSIFRKVLAELLSRDMGNERVLKLLAEYARNGIAPVNAFLKRLETNTLTGDDRTNIRKIYVEGKEIDRRTLLVAGVAAIAGIPGGIFTSCYHGNMARHAANQAERCEHEKKAKQYAILSGVSAATLVTLTITDSLNGYRAAKIEDSSEFTAAVERLSKEIGPLLEQIAYHVEPLVKRKNIDRTL